MPRGMRTENKSPGFGREHPDSRPRSLAFTSLVYLRASCVLSPRPDCKLLRVRPVFQMLATQSAPHGWGGGGEGCAGPRGRPGCPAVECGRHAASVVSAPAPPPFETRYRIPGRW